MVQCSLGTQVKADQPSYFWLSWPLFVGWLVGTYFRFLGSFVNWFPDELVVVEDFCSVEIEVPEMPGLSTWTGALLQHDANASGAIAAYLAIAYRAFLWPQYCECIPPVDATEYCTIKGPVALNYPADGSNAVCALGTNCFYFNANRFGDGSPVAVKFPVGQHKTRLTITANFNGTIEGYMTPTVAETYIGAFSSGVTTQLVHDWPTTITDLQLVWRNNTGTGGGGMDLKIEFMNTTGEAACTPAVGGDEYVPGPVEVPPELPDLPTVGLCDSLEDVCATVNLVLIQLAAATRTTGAQLAPIAPASWLPGVASTGLTGHGSLAVSGIVGVIVECAVPTWWGGYWTTPPMRKPALGAIQFGVAGMETEIRWVQLEQQLVLDAPGLTDHVVWNFNQGITGSITPLYRSTVGAP